MSITVGGLMVFFGGAGVALTILGTLFVLFAYGMSDAPQDRFSWTPSGILMGLSIVLILIGKYSGI